MREFKSLFIALACLFFLSAAASAADAPASEAGDQAVSEYVVPAPGANAPTFGSLIVTIIKICISLSIIIVFVYLTLHVLRKMMRVSPHPQGSLSLGNLAVLDVLYLGPNKMMYLVYAGKEILVIGVCEKEISLLSKIEDQAAVSEVLQKRKEQWEKTKPFGEYLRSAEKKYYVKKYLQEYLGSLKNIVKGKKRI